MIHAGGDVGMWDEEDGFFYDVLRLPDGTAAAPEGALDGRAAAAVRGHRLRGRAAGASIPSSRSDCERFLRARPELRGITSTIRAKPGVSGRRAGLDPERDQLRRVLATMLDENEFLSPYGIRSLSRYHARAPYRVPRRRAGVPRRLPAGGVRQRHVRRQLELARADLDAGERADHPRAAAVLPLLRRRLHGRVPDRLRPADEAVPGRRGDRAAAAQHLPARRARAGGRSTAAAQKFQDDPHWRDLILFYEYFHGDNGAGFGASHQTGWTGIIARMQHLFATTSAEEMLDLGKAAAVKGTARTPRRSKRSAARS